jgi:hypothetical protein
VDTATQHTQRMPLFMSSSVTSPAEPYFSTLSHKRYDFRKKTNTELRIYVFIFSGDLFEIISIPSIIQPDIFINVHRHSYTVSVIVFCKFFTTLAFSRQFLEKYSNVKSHENPPSGSQVLGGRTERQTERLDDVSSRFTKFYKSA